VKTIHDIEILRKPVLKKYLRILLIKVYFFAVSIRRIITSQVIFMKLKIMKVKYFFKKLFFERIERQFNPNKAEKDKSTSVEHKVVLILSFQLISNVFYILLHIF
jgi:hypothetical protein